MAAQPSFHGGEVEAVQPPPAPQRGISYPPLSPKSSLKRGVALQQSCSISGNKAKPGSDGITIPVITGVPTSHEDEDVVDDLEEKMATGHSPTISNDEKPHRKGRMERTDARRYHTAGAIEDIKVGTFFPTSHALCHVCSWYGGANTEKENACLKLFELGCWGFRKELLQNFFVKQHQE